MRFPGSCFTCSTSGGTHSATPSTADTASQRSIERRAAAGGPDGPAVAVAVPVAAVTPVPGERCRNPRATAPAVTSTNTAPASPRYGTCVCMQNEPANTATGEHREVATATDHIASMKRNHQ